MQNGSAGRLLFLSSDGCLANAFGQQALLFCWLRLLPDPHGDRRSGSHLDLRPLAMEQRPGPVAAAPRPQREYPYRSQRRWLDFEAFSDQDGGLTFSGAPIYGNYWQNGVHRFCYHRQADLCDLGPARGELWPVAAALPRMIGAAEPASRAQQLTPAGHGLEHEEQAAQLPEGFFVADDGVEILFQTSAC